jgi:anti-sigma-K factor RskA
VSDRPTAPAEGGAPHEHLRDDLAAYAIGALDGQDLARLERHLADCESCQDYLRWLQPAVDTLPASVGQVPPPAGLRDRLMDAVREDARTAEQAERAEAARSHRPGWRDLLLRPVTAAAAAAALVVGVVVGVAVSGDGSDATVITAKPTAAAPQGAVAATLERSGDEATLQVTKMPPLEEQQVYELWIQRGDAVEAAGTFRLNADGTATAGVGGSLDGASHVLVTAEPKGGSLEPTSDPMLSVTL